MCFAANNILLLCAIFTTLSCVLCVVASREQPESHFKYENKLGDRIIKQLLIFYYLADQLFAEAGG